MKQRYTTLQRALLRELFDAALELKSAMAQLNQEAKPIVRLDLKRDYTGKIVAVLPHIEFSPTVDRGQERLRLCITAVDSAYKNAKMQGILVEELKAILHAEGIYFLDHRQHRGDNPQESL